MRFLKVTWAYLRAILSGRSYGRMQLDEQFFSSNRPFAFFSRGGSPLGKALYFGVWHYPFTRGGKQLLVAFTVSLLIGATSVQIPIYQIYMGLLVLILVTSAVGSVFRWGKVSIEGQFPELATAGQTLQAELRVRNIGKLPLYDLSAGCFLPPAGVVTHKVHAMLHYLGPGDEATIPIRLTVLRRGLVEIPPIRIFTTFPFNLNRNQIARTGMRSILVQPRFHPLTTMRLDVGDRYQPGGISLTSNIGESPEYIGNRDYQPGDAQRRIDFRSWARLARPVVKEYQEEYYCRIALILDTFIPGRRRSPPGGYPDFEAAVSLSASVAEVLARGEFIIDLFAAGPELHIFRAGRNTAHLENVLEILAAVGVCRDNPFNELGPALVNELAQISTVVCVFLDWDETRRDLVRAAREAGCYVKVLIVRDGNTTLPLHQEGHLEFAVYAPQQITSGKVDSL